MKKLALLALVAALVVPAMAAPTVGIAADWPDYGMTIRTRYVPVDGTGWYNNYTGRFAVSYSNWQGDWDSLTGGQPLEAYTYCISTQNVSKSTITYTGVEPHLAPATHPQPMGTERAALLSELYGRFADSVVDNTSGTAFQIAVWEIVWDDSLDLTDGLFVANYGYAAGSAQLQVYGLAQNWLDTLDGTGPMANLVGLTASGNQDMITRVTPIPAPGAILLAGIGTSVVGWLRRRRAI